MHITCSLFFTSRHGFTFVSYFDITAKNTLGDFKVVVKEGQRHLPPHRSSLKPIYNEFTPFSFSSCPPPNCWRRPWAICQFGMKHRDRQANHEGISMDLFFRLFDNTIPNSRRLRTNPCFSLVFI